MSNYYEPSYYIALQIRLPQSVETTISWPVRISTAVCHCKVNNATASRKFHVVKTLVIKLRSLYSIHS